MRKRTPEARYLCDEKELNFSKVISHLDTGWREPYLLDMSQSRKCLRTILYPGWMRGHSCASMWDKGESSLAAQ